MLLRSPLSPSPPLPLSSSTPQRFSPFVSPIHFSNKSHNKRKLELSLPIVCTSISQVHSYGTVDYEKRPTLKWSSLYRRILSAERDGGAAAVVAALEEWDSDEKRLAKWDVCRVAKELRKFRNYKVALEVYEWVTSQGDRFTVESADMAIQLDLIAKVRGPLYAEQHFSNLPNSFKDKRTYCSLLNVYAQSKFKLKCESVFNLMREKGYTNDTLSFNVMMTLYLTIGENEKVNELIREMRDSNINCDMYTYNIWISNAAAMENIDEMEKIVSIMSSDNVNANWSTYTTLASMYIKLGNLEKAQNCLQEAEMRMTGRNRDAFQYFITLYGNIGKKEEVFRVWKWYKTTFPLVQNMGYKTMIQVLIKLGDIDAAEKIYEEWISGAINFDPRICHVLLGFYCRNNLVSKARVSLDRLVERGGKANQVTWEILAEGYINEKKVREGLDCIEKAVFMETRSANGKWKPRARNLAGLLEICKERNDTESVEKVIDLLRRGGWENKEPFEGLIREFSLVTA